MVEAGRCKCRRRNLSAPPSEPISCGGDEDCEANYDPNSVCFFNFCLCTPGFHLDGSVCVQECDTYGTTYIKYSNTSLTCTVQNNDVTATTAEACETSANGGVQIAYSFERSTSTCLLHFCDPIGAISFLGSNDRDVYVKNCA